MTIARAHAAGWAASAELVTADLNQLDTNPTYALDRRAGQIDALASVVSCSGAGRLALSRVQGPNASTTVAVSGGAAVRLTSSITANRTYTLATSDAIDGDLLTFFCDATFLFEVTVVSATGSFVVGNLSTSDAPFVTFMYTAASGWFVCGPSAGSRYHVAQFTTPGAFSWTCPRGVTSAIIIGCGGGGGGGSGQASGVTTSYSSGGGGGGGALMSTYPITGLTPGTVYTGVVGAGGLGVPYNASAGVPQQGLSGGVSSFSTLTFPGAAGGAAGAFRLASSGGFIVALGGLPVSVGQQLPIYSTTDQSHYVSGVAGAAVQSGPVVSGRGGASGAGAGIVLGGRGTTNPGGMGTPGTGGKFGLSGRTNGGFGGGGGAAGPSLTVNGTRVDSNGGNGGNGADTVAQAAIGVPGAGGNATGFGGGGGGGGGGSGDASTPPQPISPGGTGGNGSGGFVQVIYVK